MGIKRNILNATTVLRDSQNLSNNMAKFLSQQNNDITKKDIQQKMLVDKILQNLEK